MLASWPLLGVFAADLAEEEDSDGEDSCFEGCIGSPVFGPREPDCLDEHEEVLGTDL